MSSNSRKSTSPIQENMVEGNDQTDSHSIIVTSRFDVGGKLDAKTVIKDLLLSLQALDLELCHLETRNDAPVLRGGPTVGLSCLLIVKCTPEVLDEIRKRVEALDGVVKSTAAKSDSTLSASTTQWIPTHISDLNQCTHLLLKFQPELQTDHPGFSDPVYRRRRQEIAQLAFEYKYGDPLPQVEYSSQEVATWRQVYMKMQSLHERWACTEYLDGLKLLEKFCEFGPDHIPQIGTVSSFLERTSGFRLRPVAGLVSPRDFLANFAFRVFPCTQYIRHHSRPFHTPEPDCIHELLGHMPMLTNREFADFCQQIGLASLGATENEIKRMATLFWFTVEFGLCRQRGETRALGAGLLSSYGELENAFSAQSEKRPFDPSVVAIQTYDDVGYQLVYFVCDSIERMKHQLRDYVQSIRNYKVPHYDPYTQTVRLLPVASFQKAILTRMRQRLDMLELTVFPRDPEPADPQLSAVQP